MARAPQQRRSAAKVRAVLDAARALVDDPDPEPLTTRLLAARSGVPVATLYRYFADVEEVLDVLVSEHADATARAVEDALAHARPRTTAELFSAVLDALLAMYEREPALARRWANPQLAARQQEADLRTDRALAGRLAEEMVAHGLAAGPATGLVPLLEVQWDAAGVVLGAVLAADAGARPALEAELRALVAHLASRHPRPSTA